MTDRRPNPQFLDIDPLGMTAVRGLFTKDATQYLVITKLAIKQFLEECLRPDGQFRTFFDRFAKFTVGFNVNESLSADVNERSVQIAAFFGKARMHLPQIFIQDGGYTYVPLSLGGLSAGWNTTNRWGDQVVRISDAVKIPLTITCATTDEQEIENMAAFLSMAFGQYQVFTTGWVLHPPNREGIYWEVRLPYQHEMSAKTNAPLHEDPESQLWQITCSLTVDFENSSYMRYQAQPLFEPKDVQLTVEVPDTISIRYPHELRIRYRTDPILVYSNDPRIAIVQRCDDAFVIKPRRIGTFTLLVTKQNGPEEGPDILYQKDITITPQ